MSALSHHYAVRRFWFRLSKSQFFLGSLMVHFLLVIFLGGKAIFEQIQPAPDMIASEAGTFVSTDANPAPPPPPNQLQQQRPQFNVAPTQPTSAPAGLTAITTITTAASFSMPGMLATAPSRANTFATFDAGPALPKTISPGSLDQKTRSAIAAFTSGWSQSTSGGGGLLKSRKFKFTAYVAKYSGGDWDATVWKKGNKITGGSLSNLLYLMKTQSQDKVDASPDAEPIDLASDKLFVIKPPFIFFTGHRDFVLTDQEVENLQRYIRIGGAIWGDSSLPGERSRFDIAFRREMKRVIPDLDKQFEPLPADHEIFTKNYYAEIRSAPPGINSYQEPVYALRYNGEIAVLYTANDYGDMWQIGLDSRWQVDLRKDENARPAVTNTHIWNNRNIYFRGVNPVTVANSFKFGTNVVIHLLTRWENKVRSMGQL